MSVLDKIKGALKGHEAQVSQGVEKAGDMVDQKTQGKYASQVDMVQKKANEELGGQPPADPQ
jgi:hypothetical protein